MGSFEEGSIHWFLYQAKQWILLYTPVSCFLTISYCAAKHSSGGLALSLVSN